MYNQSILLITKSEKSIEDVIQEVLGIDARETDYKIFAKEPKKSSTGVTVIQELINWTGLKSNINKLAILDNSHTLTFEAQNKLLKVTEEPRKGIQIILKSRNKNGLLKTLLSRLLVVEDVIAEDENKISVEMLFTTDFFSREKKIEAVVLKEHEENVNQFIEHIIAYMIADAEVNLKESSSKEKVIEYLIQLLRTYSKSSNKKIFTNALNIGIEKFIT